MYLQFTGDTPGFSSLSPTKKKVVQKWSNFQKRSQSSETNENKFCYFYFLSYGRVCTHNSSKNWQFRQSENWSFIHFSTLRIFHVNMNTFAILKIFDPWIYINREKKCFFLVGGFATNTPPPGMCPWAPYAFGLRILATLVSVWIRLTKISG